MDIIDLIIKEARWVTAAVVKVPEFDNNRDLANWIKKQRYNSKIKGPIINFDTGEVLLDDGQKLTKYQLYALPKVLLGQSVRLFDKKDRKNDPREDLLGFQDLKKYYRVKAMGGGKYKIFRSDTKPFKSYDIENIESISLDDFDADSEAYRYGGIDGLKEGIRYIDVEPEGMNIRYVLDNFDNFYSVKYKPLKTYYEKGKEEIYSDYDEDLDIPAKIEKKDKSSFVKDDFEVINKWLKDRFRGEGVKIEIYGKPGKKQISENEIMLVMAR